MRWMSRLTIDARIIKLEFHSRFWPRICGSSKKQIIDFAFMVKRTTTFFIFWEKSRPQYSCFYKIKVGGSNAHKFHAQPIRICDTFKPRRRWNNKVQPRNASALDRF